MSGSNLESVEYFGKGIEKIVVVGRIEKVKKHLIPLFRLPSEPNVRLRKNTAK